MLGKYLLFAGDNYYPEGGTRDYQGAFPTYEDAKKVGDATTERGGVARREFDWYEVVYHPTMKRVLGEVSEQSS